MPRVGVSLCLGVTQSSDQGVGIHKKVLKGIVYSAIEVRNTYSYPYASTIQK